MKMDVNESMSSLSIECKITGVSRLKFKLSIATFLINIASWIIRPGKIEIEVEMKEQGETSK
jgi:hypothetical protein